MNDLFSSDVRSCCQRRVHWQPRRALCASRTLNTEGAYFTPWSAIRDMYIGNAGEHFTHLGYWPLRALHFHPMISYRGRCNTGNAGELFAHPGSWTLRALYFPVKVLIGYPNLNTHAGYWGRYTFLHDQPTGWCIGSAGELFLQPGPWKLRALYPNSWTWIHDAASPVNQRTCFCFVFN